MSLGDPKAYSPSARASDAFDYCHLLDTLSWWGERAKRGPRSRRRFYRILYHAFASFRRTASTPPVDHPY